MKKLLFLIALLFFLHHSVVGIENDAKQAANLAVNNGNGTDAASLVGDQKKDEDLRKKKKKGEESEELKPKEEEKEEKEEKGSSDEKKTRVVECDPSNKCIVDKSKLVACLRVSGKDSLDLSLLIQNKGTGPLDVTIHAPDSEFVSLEFETVQLKAQEDKEVKVSVKDGGNETVIILKAGEGICSLNFQNIVSDTSTKSEISALPGSRLGRLSIRSSFMLAILAAVLVVGLALSCVRFWRIKAEGGSRYQQLDVGLPVSTSGKDGGDGDGWDNSWADDWDDEEAPVTPSMPVLTPSSKGLASRKFSKDSWKD